MSAADANTPAPVAAASTTSDEQAPKEAILPTASPHARTASPAPATPPKTSLDTSSRHSADPTHDFAGDIDTNNTLPTQDLLRRIEDYPVLDKDGKSRPFKSLYTGPNVAPRVLIIFVRHFFCGSCQEYLRTLSASITSDSLLQLPVPTFIAVIACGAPSLIQMYADTTRCPFPIYADPTTRLYDALGMVRSLALGARPAYQRKGFATSVFQGIVQGLRQLPSGRALAGGDYHQVGGEFLFEPAAAGAVGSPVEAGEVEKRVAWCHRMRNTRDHVEIPELREVLGLDGVAGKGQNGRRWARAVSERKGTGQSAMSVEEGGEVLTGVLTGEPRPEGAPSQVVEEPGELREGGAAALPASK